MEQAAKVLKVSYSHMLRLLNGHVHGRPRIACIRAGRSLRVRHADRPIVVDAQWNAP